MSQQDIPNCEFTGDPNQKSEINLWYKCPKCKRRIWNHLYNEHVHNCSRAKVLRENAMKNNPNLAKQPVEKKRLVARFGSTASRHRKRPPVNR